MTDDYKTKLLKYLTGNLDVETGANEPQEIEAKTIQNNIVDFVKEKDPTFTDNNINIVTIFTRNDYIILWCSLYDRQPVSQFVKAYIVILDKNFIPLNYIDKYKSGAPLNLVMKINKYDKGTGKIYCQDVVFENGEPSYNRICVLNDFTLNNFEVQQLATFRIPNYNNYPLNINNFCKNENEGKYFMTYYTYDSSTYAITGGGALEFVNVVGGTNEWNFYPYSGNYNAKFTGSEQSYPIWNENGLTFTIFTYYTKAADANHNTIGLIVLKENVSNDTKTTVPDKTISLPPECKNVGQIMNCIRQYNIVLFSTTTTETLNSTYYLIQLDTTTENYKIFEKYESDSVSSLTAYDFSPFLLNNQFYYCKMQVNYNSQYEILSRYLYLMQIYNNNKYLLYSNTSLTDFSKALYSNNTYNLNEMSFIFDDVVLQLKQIFNPNNYNGLPYEATNCLVPFSGVLYDNNDNIIFARNLYNKTVSGQTTTSVVQIPNTLLNDVTIAQNDLIGQTNGVLVSDNTQFTKNIYETVDLNFSNTLIIRNDNNLDNKILNPVGAARLNDSVSQTTDYSNAQATKIKINYADNTNRIIQLDSSQIKLMSNTVAKYLFSIYVNKEISNIQIISHDENTIYQTINVLGLTVGNIYRFIQYVSTTGEIVKNNVLYNGEQVNYDGEAVMYIN